MPHPGQHQALQLVLVTLYKLPDTTLGHIVAPGQGHIRQVTEEKQTCLGQGTGCRGSYRWPSRPPAPGVGGVGGRGAINRIRGNTNYL